ncbi:RNA polymerase sigma factor [Robiginitalea sp. SC105]|uniref:RNA polymerase sigma factor n=1 Tax=Robiginitalea sp. SC105 TaxID=2762332 RepID=UPI00163B518B|nr:RNA polymerase sigma factor [Robiginitalea sp. SC105]MBC2838428.1 RNA polymerase sigma factor [Robiginitalea sp. SC105]
MASGEENYNNLTNFFRDEYQSLNGYVRSRIEDTGERDAEDIIQDVALRLFSRTDDLSQINNIAGFVYRAIRNRIIDVMRTRKGRQADQSQLEARWTEFAELFYENSGDVYPEVLMRQLKAGIEGLKPDYREVILVIDFEGYTYREYAGMTGISPGTLMSRRHRALSILQKKLKGYNTN